MATSAGAIELDPSEGPRVLPRIWSPLDLILGIVVTTVGAVLLVGAVGLLLFLGSHAWRFYTRYAQGGPCWYESPEARDGDPTRP